MQAWLRLLAFLGIIAGLVAPARVSGQERDDVRAQAAQILAASGVKGGLVVHVGCGDGRLTAALRAAERFLVHGIATNAADVDRARAAIRERGLYGTVSVDVWDGAALPYADNLVNLLVVSGVECRVSGAEVKRVLAPNGVAITRDAPACIPRPASRSADGFVVFTKPWPAEIDEWTHYLHGADGNPVAHDALVGPPKRLQWVGSPAWARHHDHMASMTSLVSAGGRLFYIFDEGSPASIQLPSVWRLNARDAFSGTILWKRNIERWNTRQYPLKSGPAHLLRRLVAAGDRVYVTLGIDAALSALDAVTGESVRTYEDTQYTREIVLSEGVLLLVADTAPSRLPEWRREATYVWDNTHRANRDWGWQGTTRRVLAHDAATGRRLWGAEFPVAPCSLAAAGGRVVFHDGKQLICLSRRDGTTLWVREEVPIRIPVFTSTGPRVLIYGDVVLYAGSDANMSGYSVSDGTKLWEQKRKPSGHLSLQDLFVVDGLVWTAAIAASNHDGIFAGYDAVTGEKKREFDPDIKVQWFHHRCYPSKATDRYLITARNGTEFVDVQEEHWNVNHWVRGGCIYGVMPCNGMVYAPMHSCGCQLEAKLTGFNALSAAPVPAPSRSDLAPETRLERGPAYGKAASAPAAASDWPTYRHDAARSGATSGSVSSSLKQAWACDVGGKLSALTIANGMVFTASVNAHTLHALDAATGKVLWTYTTGGRIDSPPTYFQGLAIFGSADGCAYAVRASDGVLAWRFRAAPVDRRMVAWEQVESAWPVHGSVLIQDGVLHCTAGRSMFLDGGIRYLRLDPMTGQLLGETVMDDTDPETGEDMHKYVKGMNMAVGLSDILSCNGQNVFMRSQKFDLAGNRVEIEVQDVNKQDPESAHIFCQVGFLDDSWFFRSYWTYGRRVNGGYGGWFQAGRVVPSGRILAVDDRCVYGYGRKPEYMVNASVVEYQLFAADKAVTEEAIQRLRESRGRMNRRLDRSNGNSSDWRLRRAFPVEDLTSARFGWRLDQPSVMARALAVSSEMLFIAGPDDLLDERRAFHDADDPEVQELLAQQAEALAGRHGGQLWVLSKADGKVVARYALDTIPVFDGMAVAGDRLFISTVDGRVLCFAAQGPVVLASADTRPTRVAWDVPEDPNYLQPPPVDKSGDFDTVVQCRVEACDLGYKICSSGKKKTCLAVNKLDPLLTGKSTLSTTLRVPVKSGYLVNGFIAFGTSAKDADLVKCGIRFQPQKASIMQGPLLKPTASKAFDIKVPVGDPVALVVDIDLDNGTVKLTVQDHSVEVQLSTPVKAITHAGFAADSAVAEFSPLDVKQK